MPARKSIIKSIQSEGGFDGKYGYMYKWEVAMENGDVGEVLSKDEEHKTFNEGDQKEYHFEAGKFPKIKWLPKKEERFISDKNSSQPASFALSYAKDIWVAHIQAGKEFTSKECFLLADKNLEWLKKQMK